MTTNDPTPQPLVIAPTEQLSTSVRAYTLAVSTTMMGITELIDNGRVGQALELMERVAKDHNLVIGVMRAAIKHTEANRAS